MTVPGLDPWIVPVIHAVPLVRGLRLYTCLAAWMTGTRPVMTSEGSSCKTKRRPNPDSVMTVPGLDPGIVPVIHAVPHGAQFEASHMPRRVDDRHKAGHDERGGRRAKQNAVPNSNSVMTVPGSSPGPVMTSGRA